MHWVKLLGDTENKYRKTLKRGHGLRNQQSQGKAPPKHRVQFSILPSAIVPDAISLKKGPRKTEENRRRQKAIEQERLQEKEGETEWTHIVPDPLLKQFLEGEKNAALCLSNSLKLR